MGQQQGSAFITTRKGVCYVTLKCAGRNFHISRIRNYTLDAEDKRDLRRLYPEVIFDWKKITRQLAEKREVCRGYRSRRRHTNPERLSAKPSYAVYDPTSRTLYVDGAGAEGIAFLDVLLSREHGGHLKAQEQVMLPTVPEKKRRKIAKAQ